MATATDTATNLYARALRVVAHHAREGREREAPYSATGGDASRTRRRDVAQIAARARAHVAAISARRRYHAPPQVRRDV
jgi:hypothetical protein